MTLPNALLELQSAIDFDLHDFLETILKDYPVEYISMFNYQLGWEGQKNGKDAQGKRIRPLLLLVANLACGGNWRNTLPAAAAVELVHNFSLIHDDVQDCSETRRGRPTVWVKWGEAQAINAGDAMLTVAQLSLLRLSAYHDCKVVDQAVSVLQNACLKLTRGQYLDIAFENKDDLPMELYWQMVEGKTSSLLAACLTMGALLAGANGTQQNKMMEFGHKIGAAFQVQDDWLGIWGDCESTGKSITSDLVAKKKTYPILLGILEKGQFLKLWQSLKKVTPENACQLADLLEKEGHRESTKKKFEELYSDGFGILDSLALDVDKSAPLKYAIQGLFGRIK